MIGGENSIGECAKFYYYPIEGKSPIRECLTNLTWGVADTNCKELSININVIIIINRSSKSNNRLFKSINIL